MHRHGFFKFPLLNTQQELPLAFTSGFPQVLLPVQAAALQSLSQHSMY